RAARYRAATNKRNRSPWMPPTMRTASGKSMRYLSGIAIKSRITKDVPSKNAIKRKLWSAFIFLHGHRLDWGLRRHRRRPVEMRTLRPLRMLRGPRSVRAVLDSCGHPRGIRPGGSEDHQQQDQ